MVKASSLPSLMNINNINQMDEHLSNGDNDMNVYRLFNIVLICAAMMMVGLNKSRIAFANSEPKNQIIHRQLSEVDNTPEVTRYYVARTGDGSDGSSWEKAYTNVQTALINAASNGGGEIWVAKGVYYPDEDGYTDNQRTSNFGLNNNVFLYGGFDTNDTKMSDRDWEKNLTVLSGDIDGDDFTNVDGVVVDTDNINGNNAFHVVRATNIENSAVIDGFVITAGNAYDDDKLANGGGGLLCQANTGSTCNLILKNILFSGNYARSGGAILFQNFGVTSSPTIENVTFSSNSAFYSGGAIYNWAGECKGDNSLLLTNVNFYDNRAAQNGGAIHNGNNTAGCILSPILSNVVFSGNYAEWKGGAMDNYGSFGGKIIPTLTNVTISGNSASEGGGAIYNRDYDDGEVKPQIRNSILWNNMEINGTKTISSSIYQLGDKSKTYFVNSIVQDTGNSGGGSWIDDENIVDGGGNIDTNPLFVIPVDPATAPTADGDLRLTENSPAIDMGDNAYISKMYDLDGKARKVDGDSDGAPTVDMGAYEYQIQFIFDINLPLIIH